MSAEIPTGKPEEKKHPSGLIRKGTPEYEAIVNRINSGRDAKLAQITREVNEQWRQLRNAPSDNSSDIE